ncbi:uncharacterized protein QTN25_004675 [Entamoeba marina]
MSVDNDDLPPVCTFWLKDECAIGNCPFRHWTDEVCKYWMMGSCMKGDDCKYVHPARDTETYGFSDPEMQQMYQQFLQMDGIESFTPVEDKDNNLENFMDSPVDTTKLRFDAIRYVPDKKKPKPRSQNSTFTYADKMKLNEIKTLFPKLDDKEIEHEYRLNGFDHLKTIEALKQTFGDRGGVPKKLESIEITQQKEFKRKKETASEYSEKGDEYAAIVEKLEKEVVDDIFYSINSKKSLNEGTIDLHGLHVKEALPILDKFLTKRKGGRVYIITGSGHHSMMGIKMLKAVDNFLKNNKYEYADCSPDKRGGMFVVELQNKSGVQKTQQSKKQNTNPPTKTAKKIIKTKKIEDDVIVVEVVGETKKKKEKKVITEGEWITNTATTPKKMSKKKTKKKIIIK